MANLSHPRNAVSELGGKQLRDHRLVFDAPASARYSDQRASSDEAASSRSNHETGGRGSEQSAGEDVANEDDDEDSSTPDDQEDDEGNMGGFAPSHGLGKGKGKRPAIRVEPANNDESEDDDETTSHETGLMSSKHPVTQLLMQNKKRTFSNLSNTSVLFGDDDTDQHMFPRRKVPRKLSNLATKPLLTYQENANGTHVNDFENAIESDDDDEDYSGVNLVPDDDESDMENMEMQEESFIIEDERQHANGTATALINEYTDARRLSLDSSASDNIFELTAPLDEAFLAGIPDYGFAQFFESETLPSSPEPAVKRKYSDSSTKRVRFDDEVQVSDSSSTSSSEELDSTLFPDLFMEQDKLPPILHQLIENDNDEDDGDAHSPMSDVSFWDYGNDEAHLHNNNHSDFDDDSSDPGSSGYETDMGDTTDDDSDFASDAPPQTPVQKKSVLRKPSSAPGSRASTPKPFQRNSRPTGRQIPPARGIFIHNDSNKAIAVTDRATKTLSFYRPRTQIISWIPLNGTQSSTTSTANNSPRTSVAQFNASDSEISNEVFNNAYSTDIMLSGIFGSAPGSFMFGGESVGPPEAFYPFVSIGSQGNIMDDEDEYIDSEDYEDDLNITDFMDFGSDGDDTDVEQEEETDVPATPATSMIAMTGSTPAQPTPMSATPTTRKRTTSDVMLEHFDRGVVTAFRNNQNRYRDISCLPSDPNARASVSRPVRTGRSAETVITPLRKRSNSKRTTKSPFHASSPLRNKGSPLAGVTKAASRLQHSVMSAHRGPPPRMGTFS